MRILSTSFQASKCKGCRAWLTNNYEFIDNMHLKCIREMSLMRIYLPSMTRDGLQLNENSFISIEDIKKSGKTNYLYGYGPAFHIQDEVWRVWQDWLREAREAQERREELQSRENFANLHYEILLEELGLGASDWVGRVSHGHDFLTGRTIIGGDTDSIYVIQGARTQTDLWDQEIMRRNYLDLYYRHTASPQAVLQVTGSVEFINAIDYSTQYPNSSIIRSVSASVKPAKKKKRSHRSKITTRDNQLTKLLDIRPLTKEDKVPFNKLFATRFKPIKSDKMIGLISDVF
ncbi:hypothetical protein LCGC14_0267890 [marine sediment metagenome]|uniref:Uncharacterized protein n=1 Tax=marine sediment metagenome TaxID=412755 RepID=A0A0F9X4Y0_9ZZZZ